MDSKVGECGGGYNLRKSKRRRVEVEVEEKEEVPSCQSDKTDRSSDFFEEKKEAPCQSDKTGGSSDFFEEEDVWDDAVMDLDGNDLYEEGEEDEDDLVSEGEVDCQLSSSKSSSSGSIGGSVDQGICVPSTSRVKLSAEDKDGDDGFLFEVLSAAQVAECMEGIVNEANEILQLDPTIMRLLLNHFGWDKQKLLETYYLSGDTEKLFKEAKILESLHAIQDEGESSDAWPSIGNRRGGYSEEKDEEDCQICYLTKPISALFGSNCGHRFCTDCWTQYLTERISEGGSALQAIPCAGHNCPVYLSDSTVFKILSGEKLEKYQQMITNKFVQCNRLFKWCPGPGCNFAIKVMDCLEGQGGSGSHVKCDCNHAWCFKCCNDDHTPVDCDMLKLWQKKCADDSETSNWIMAFTKDCPKCKMAIEKNGGCNHLVCKHCNHEFCWFCMQPWRNHQDAYKCTKFLEAGAAGEKGTSKKKNDTRESLRRYLFYFDHFNNQRNSLRLETGQLKTKMDTKVQELVKALNVSEFEIAFLKKAVEVLRECRQTLMNTYALAFYMESNNHKQIFEDNQADLAIATEKLSGYLESDIDFDVFDEIKQKGQDMLRYCAGRRQVLLDHVKEGKEKGSLKFTKA